MEKPGIDANGKATWQTDGKRQRYAQRLLETVGAERLFVAAAFVMRHRRGIPDGASFKPTADEVTDCINWMDLAQLRKLGRIAKGLIVETEPLQ